MKTYGLHINIFVACRAADLLLGGAVMGRVFQPYEAHIPYLLQVLSFKFNYYANANIVNLC